MARQVLPSGTNVFGVYGEREEFPHLVLTEAQLRAEIVAEAITWLGTPFHHEARVKGAGVDCAQLLIAVYSTVGLIEAFATDHYPPDWGTHRDEPKFLAQLTQHCMKAETPKSGDVVMFRYGRNAAHGGIWLDGARVLHSWCDEGCVTVSDLEGAPLGQRIHGYYRWSGFAP